VIPVLWTTFHPDAPCRGYWDQGWLERVLSGRVRRTRHEFESVEVRSPAHWPHPEIGAVVVLPGSYNADRIAEVNAFIDRLSWAVLFITSDEESLFPVEQLRHPRLIVYVEPDMERLYDDGVRFLGMQCKADTHDLLAERQPEMAYRKVDVFFAGQVTHARRERCADAVLDARRYGLSVDQVFTESFTAGLPREEYLTALAGARVAPCPSGPAIVDSFRLWEALEAGCVPVADARREGSKEGYWQRAFGDPAFPILDDWSEFPLVARRIVDNWPSDANRVQAWWQRWQRDFTVSLDDTIDRLSGVGTPVALADLLTVMVPSSPIESHPSTAVLDETLDSIEERLPGVEVIVGFDGVRPEQAKFVGVYGEYVNRALTGFSFGRGNVTPVVLPEWGHQANVTRAMLDLVRTPVVLFVEHDCPLQGDIPFDALTGLVAAGEANVVRLLHEANILEPHRHLMLDDEPRDVAGVPLVGTIQWSQRPHLASTAYYRHILHRYFGRESRTMIEDVMHGVVQRAAEDGGWGMDRIFIYAPPGDMKRSTTSDGRGSEPKFDMLVAYDGDQPEWAPRPTVETDEYRQPAS
jgi:hypothetical protein